MSSEMQLLKRVASLNDEALSENTDPDYQIQYIDIGNVNSDGKINEIMPYQFRKAPSRARRL
ncbi:MAG: restriction endonuclease subunit S, partial [Anaerolineae bacterium]|nr:restriction endonuclease subunit S [Anaerolineae bacterium]